MSSRVGVASEALAAKGPAWDSSGAREAGVKSERCISYARLSQAWQRLLERPTFAGNCGVVGTGCGAGLADQPGASKPQSQKCCRARVARQDALGAGGQQRRARGPARQGGCRTKTPSELRGGRSWHSAGLAHRTIVGVGLPVLCGGSGGRRAPTSRRGTARWTNRGMRSK